MNPGPVVVVGAGISGLTVAYRLLKQGQAVTVFEAADRPGGAIWTTNDGGWLLDHGPNSLLVNRQGVLNLFEELGLADSMIEANPQAKRRYIVRGGRLHALPSSPLSFLRTPLFTARDKVRLFKEPFIGKGPQGESVAEFVRRRLGQGFYDYAINPFVSGVYAGDPEQLSASDATRKVYRLEEKHGSLIRGALAMVLGFDRPEGRIKGRLISFKEGMGALPAALARALGDRLHLNCPVDHLERRPEGGWRGQARGESFEAERVILATPADTTADLLALAPNSPLSTLPYAPVSVVHLGFERRQVKHPLDGFGCLIPRKEGIQSLGILFSTTLFPGRAPGEDRVLLTAFIGGATFPQIREWSEEETLQKVLDDCHRLLGVEGTPQFSRVTAVSRAIPQYTLGHQDRLASIRERLGGIEVRANWSDGISVPDCILAAEAMATSHG